MFTYIKMGVNDQESFSDILTNHFNAQCSASVIWTNWLLGNTASKILLVKI